MNPPFAQLADAPTRKTRAYIAINGIKNAPGRPTNWNEAFCRWVDNPRNGVEERTGRSVRVDRYEYHSSILLRWLGQKRRGLDLADIIDAYAWADEVVLIAHSNGAEIIRRAMQDRPYSRIHSMHLIAPATWADFDRNGFNDAFAQKRLGSVTVYRMLDDWAMRAALLTTPLHWLGLGYGTLGYWGPVNVRPEYADRVKDVPVPGGHSSMILPDQFDATCRLLTA